jgi:hypothetical protein
MAGLGRVEYVELHDCGQADQANDLWEDEMAIEYTRTYAFMASRIQCVVDNNEYIFSYFALCLLH